MGEPPFPLAREHPHYRPPHQLFLEAHRRYGRPMILSETGAEGPTGPDWMRYIAGEVDVAVAAGADLQGVCLYPVMDYPGWTDGRHCPCGLIEVAPGWGERAVNPAMAQALREIDRPASSADRPVANDRARRRPLRRSA